MLGNDDPVELRADPRRGAVGRRTPRARSLPLDDDHEMISLGLLQHHPLAQPPRADRGASSPRRSGAMVARAPRPGAGDRQPPRPAVSARGLDDAPVLDADLTVQQSLGQVKFAPVGSTAVRDLLLERRSRCSGCTATSTSRPAIRRIGRTIAINPGSDYATGALNGAPRSRSSATRSRPTSWSGAER